MRREGNKDRPDTNHIIENIVDNGGIVGLTNQEEATNSSTFVNAGSSVFPVDHYKWSRMQHITFLAASGYSVPTGGMEIELYDVTNSTQIGLLSFLTAEIDTIKSIEVLPYFQALGKDTLLIEVNFRRISGGNPATIRASSLDFHGKFPNIFPVT